MVRKYSNENVICRLAGPSEVFRVVKIRMVGIFRVRGLVQPVRSAPLHPDPEEERASQTWNRKADNA